MKKIILLSVSILLTTSGFAFGRPGMFQMGMGNNQQMGGMNQNFGMQQMGGNNQQQGMPQFANFGNNGQIGGNNQFGGNQQFGGMNGNDQQNGQQGMPQFGNNDQMGGNSQFGGNQQFGGMNGNDQQNGQQDMPQFGNNDQMGGNNQFGDNNQFDGCPPQFGGVNPPKFGGNNIDIIDGSDYGNRPERPDDFDFGDRPQRPEDFDDNSENNINPVITTDSSATKLYDVSGNEIKSGSASVNFSGTSKTINAAYLINGVEVEISSGTYASKSNSSNQTVFLVVNGGKLTIEGDYSNPVVINKTGSAASNCQVNDNYNFYGINSAIVVAGDESSAEIKNASINTSANGSNAVVSTANANVEISDTEIVTTGSAGSRGLHATYGGTINANNVSIKTNGASSAALATDRGSGTINAENMTLETNSAGSPLVYSTGVINVTSSTGSANAAQMVVVEGGSSATITECDFSCSGKGNRTGTSESNDDSHVVDAAGIFIYQSFSGDSSVGTDYFTAVDSTFRITESDVPMFYLTNISAKINLSGNTFDYSSDYLLVAEETDQWGRVGSNGGKATLTLNGQNVSGEKAFVGESSSSLSVSSSSGEAGLIIENGTW